MLRCHYTRYWHIICRRSYKLYYVALQCVHEVSIRSRCFIQWFLYLHLRPAETTKFHWICATERHIAVSLTLYIGHRVDQVLELDINRRPVCDVFQARIAPLGRVTFNANFVRWVVHFCVERLPLLPLCPALPRLFDQISNWLEWVDEHLHWASTSLLRETKFIEKWEKNS